MLATSIIINAQCAPDVTPPTITCPGDVIAACPHSPILNALAPTTFDNCGSVVLQTYTLSGATTGSSPSTGIHDVNSVIFLAGNTTVSYYIEDTSGNSATCNFNVNVTDHTAPIVVCQDDVVAVNDSGSCTANVNMFDFNVFPTAYDSCSGLSTVPTGVPAGSNFPVGTTTVIWVVTDAAGNFTTCPQDITVTDEEDPTITCPSNISANTDAGQCTATITIPLVIANDNCSVSSVTNDFNGGGADASGTYPIGTTTVTFTVTDPTNKTATCSMDVVVTNNQSPTITLLGSNPLTLEACDIYTEFGATANDACFGNISGDIIIDSSTLDPTTVGSYQVTYTVDNASGNTTQIIRTVNVIDTTNSSLTLIGPNPLTIGDCSTYTELGASLIDPCFDDISGNVIIDNSNVDTTTLGSYTVTYTGMDDSGNPAIPITRTINVIDNSPPDITLIGDNPQIIEACDPYIELGATALDPCFNIDFTSSIITDASGIDTSTPGIYTVIYSVTDSFGNTSIDYIRDIEVIDTINPSITCPSDITLNNNVGDCSAIVTYADPVGVDNCPITITQITGLPSGSTFPIGTTTNTFEVSDNDGNTATCSFDVTVNDFELPVAVCTNFSVELNPTTGLATISPNDIDNGSSDNCNFTLSASQTDFDCSHIGDNVVTLTITDDTGNFSTCDATVTITDNSVNAAVTISTPINPICENESVTFTATPTEGGTAPNYQWQLNGTDISSANSSTYTSNTLIDGDEITVNMTSNATACAQSVTSNTITMVVVDNNPSADAGPDITSSICTNTTVTLAANAIIGSGTTGLWTVTSGQSSGFSFSDDSSPTSTFTGDIGEIYTLVWTIDNPLPCNDSDDSMTVTFINCTALDFDGVDDNITFRNNYNFNSDFTIELWIKSEVSNVSTQTILSKREATNQIDGYDLRIENNYVSFNWNNGESLLSPNQIITNQWHHVAVVLGSGTYTLYIDGVEMNSVAGSVPISNTVDCILGAMDETITPPFKPMYYFNGGMDELRIWNTALSSTQIRKMMNQEIENNSGSIVGSIIPIDISGLTWTNLNGYYQMNQATDLSGGNLTSTNANSIEGLLRYMTTLQPESAPIPYHSFSNGLWSNTSTWLHGAVQAIPNSLSIDGSTQIDWNIVNSAHKISSGNINIKLLGLNVVSDTLSIENVDPLNGQSLSISDYLKIDGTLDLVGESQLIQDIGSIVDYNGTGNLQRDQQGTTNLYNYNYWSSPVSLNGNTFSIGSILNDGTTYTNPQSINWTNAHDATGSINPITLSSKWIYTFQDSPGTDYFDWVSQNNTSFIDVGLGFTLKGSGVGDPILDLQNYVFIGQPNNGEILVPIIAPYQALIGNPYPSAVNADQFIIDNGPSGTNAINGSLYFWEHATSNTSHVLSEYEGGYATYSLSGGVAAVSAPSEIGGLGSTGKIPGQFIPIAQGFYVTSSTSGGTIEFNNSQRVFEKESTSSSIFLRTSENNIENTTNNTIKRIRLEVKLPDGALRPLLLAFTPNNEATEGLDYGYDAENTENFINDASFMIEDLPYVIQGTSNFDVTKQYPLGLFISTSGTVEISLKSIENFENNIDVFIYDSATEIYTNINEFDSTLTLNATDYIDRFFITFEAQDTLTTGEHFNDELTLIYLNDSNEIYIKLTPTQDAKLVSLHNVVGQQVKSWQSEDLDRIANEIRIPIKLISEGIYVVKLTTNDERVISKKLIIKN